MMFLARVLLVGAAAGGLFLLAAAVVDVIGPSVRIAWNHRQWEIAKQRSNAEAWRRIHQEGRR